MEFSITPIDPLVAHWWHISSSLVSGNIVVCFIQILFWSQKILSDEYLYKKKTSFDVLLLNYISFQLNKTKLTNLLDKEKK